MPEGVSARAVGSSGFSEAWPHLRQRERGEKGGGERREVSIFPAGEEKMEKRKGLRRRKSKGRNKGKKEREGEKKLSHPGQTASTLARSATWTMSGTLA